MPDKLDLINGALVRIGANEITSIDDDSIEAMTARRLYPNTVNDLGTRYPWRFLIGVLPLARLATQPATDGWGALYALPTDAQNIKAVTINNVPISFERYTDTLACNASETEIVHCEYGRPLHEMYFPGYFCTLVEYELAANFAIPVGDRGDLAEFYEKKALRHFSLAKTIDAQSRTTQKLRTGRFHQARWGTR